MDPRFLRLLTTLGSLLLALSVAAWIINRIRLRYRDNDGPEEGDQQLLLQISDLRREGDLTDEEYRSIKGRLIKRLDNTLSASPQEPSESSPEHSDETDETRSVSQN